VPLAPDGSPMLGEGASPLERELHGGMFDAALDAAAGHAWPRHSTLYGDGGNKRYWSRQGRLLALAMDLSGVTPGSESADAIALLLGVPRMLLDEQARTVDAAPGYRSRGLAVCAVLHEMNPGPQRTQRLMESGCTAGRWGLPWYWDPQARSLRRMPFRVSGTRDPPPPDPPPCGSTKVGR